MNLISRNRLLVLATDRIPLAFKKVFGRKGRNPFLQTRIEGIDTFCQTGTHEKRALLTLSPEAWTIALRDYPNITGFNFIGLTFEIVRALNRRGYVVDIIDYRYPDVAPSVNYDLVVAHGPNCSALLESLPKSTFVIQYASGAYWKAFNEMSRERYNDFCMRRALPQTETFFRSLEGTEEGEEVLARRADATFIPGPRTLATWKDVSKRPKLIYSAAYREQDLVVAHDLEKGRRNFIYVAGSNGNIQKGLDILLEAFSRNRRLNLFIYCRIEDEVLRAYDRILALPNIHYVYHLGSRLLRGRLARLLAGINFTITAPIDTGSGTAFVGSLGLGLIPVGYVDLPLSIEEGCLSNSWKIEAIEEVIISASEMPVPWCHNASALAIQRYFKHHEPASFAEQLGRFLDEGLAGK